MSLASFSPHAAARGRGGTTATATATATANTATSSNTMDHEEEEEEGEDHSNSMPSSLPVLPGQLHYPYNKKYVSSSGRSLEAPPALRLPPPPSSSTASLLAATASNAHPSHPSTLHQQPHYFYVLPVLLLEFLALALTRAVLPAILLREYGNRTYLILGCADCVKGALAFLSCPFVGKVSDQVLGRKPCLFVTVLGTCAPVCSLALYSWTKQQAVVALVEGDGDDADSTTFTTSTTSTISTALSYSLPPMAIPIFVILLSLSGLFSSTFTLVFAYISDTIPHTKGSKDERVSAYGLALATFGLSFTIGPMAGGYLVTNTYGGGDGNNNPRTVFAISLLLTILDLLYIAFILPESKVLPSPTSSSSSYQQQNDTTVSILSSATTTTSTTFFLVQEQLTNWKPQDSIQIIWEDPFLRTVGKIALLYYTGLWAVISTLSLYAVQHFHLTPQTLGELMSALGLCTMIAEAVLVRILVPLWGEAWSIRVGLLSFAGQCLVLGAAYEPWHLFVCVGFSLLGNLVYPSLSSLVCSVVEPHRVGEALGALNGVKALTEGVGPLVFGALMTISESVSTQFPGWPYWIAALLVWMAHDVAQRELPKFAEGGSATPPRKNKNKTTSLDPDQEYVHELEFKKRRRRRRRQGDDGDDEEEEAGGCWPAAPPVPSRDEEDEEYQDLLPLSEVEESEEDR